MKRTQFSVLSHTLAAILIAAFLCAGCKPSGEGASKDESGAKSDAASQGAEALLAEDWARAYDKFSDAIAADAKDVDAYYGRAAAAGGIAENHYRLAKAAATNNDVKSGTDEATKADEYFQKLKDDCKKVLELDPKYADAYFLLGVAAQYQGAWQDGLDAFAECIKLEPDRAEAYHHRGEIYDNIGDYMNSSVDFKKASELGYKDAGSADEAAPASDDMSDLNYDAADSATPDSAPAENAD